MTSRSLGHRAPLLWLVVPMIGGLVAARVIDFSSVPLVLGAAASIAGVAVWSAWRKPSWLRPALCLAMFFSGAASYSIHRPRIEAWDRLPPREARVTIHVQRVFPQPELQRASGLGVITAAEGPLQEVVGQRVYFSLTLGKGVSSPIRSAMVAATGVIASLPRDPPPNSFDRYLVDACVNFRLSRGRVQREVQPPHPYFRFCANQAERFAAILSAGVDAKRPSLVAVLRAMLLGQQHELSEEQDALFRQSGTMHVFSISGLHIAVIAGGLHAMLRLLRLPRVVQFVVGLAALWLYVDITGRAPSAVRAFAMVALVETSLLLRTPRNPIAALATSAFFVVIFAPLQVFSASFQLSYGIVAALLLVGLPLSEGWQEKFALFSNLPPVSWTWMHRLVDAAWRATIVAMALGIAASLVSALAGVMFFELFTPGALLSNLWLIPASTAVILTGFISLLCGLVGFAAGSVVANHAAVLLLAGIEQSVRWFAAMPGAWFEASFRAGWMGPAALALLMAAMAWGYARGWRGGARGYWAPVAVVALALAFGVSFG